MNLKHKHIVLIFAVLALGCRPKKGIVTKEKISSLEKRLPDFFLRVHRSYLINIKKITSFSKTGIETKGETLPISRTYKKEALDILSKNV